MAMYQHFFGLQREPFSIAPDPRFLFMSERHREALAHLLFGLQTGGGFVLLTGEVPNAAVKAEAEKIAQSVSEVRSVVNELQIGPASSFGNRGNDSFISGKVKAAFISHAKFQPNHVKVITEGGVVYLLGLVTRGEAETATEIARTVGGVQKVVRVFEYVLAAPKPPVSEPAKK